MSTSSRLQQRFILLAAILLLMQSFALWHDVSHPFHLSEVECERFEAVAHTPIADTTYQAELVLASTLIRYEQPIHITPISQQQRDTDTIRAPPFLFC